MIVESMENVQVFESEGKGRGLKATKEFWAGDVIFAEPAYAAVVMDNLNHVVCHTCFKRQEKLQRCGQCKFAHYCDRTCQKDGWAEHKQECSAIRKYGKVPNQNTRLAARIMWRIEREGSAPTEGSLVSPDELQSHTDDFSEEEKKELLADVHGFLDFWPSHSKQFGMQYISHIFGVINCNGYTMSDQRGLQAVGVGLFPNICLVNHDCWPNCTVIINNGKIELRANSKISKGDELNVSYVDFINTSQDRKKQLKQQYYFDCTCDHCSKGIKDDLMLAMKEDQDNKPSTDVVKKVIEFTKASMEKIETARSEGCYHEVVKLCRECLKKQEPVLADTNIYMLRILSIASEMLSYLQNFEEAAEYARKMVDGYVKLYHPNNAQLGMAIMRAGVTHWHAALIEVGHGMICKAYAVLLVTHGPTHPITKDLEAMRVQTEMELRMFHQNEYMYYQMREAALKSQKMKIMAEPSDDIIKGMLNKRK
ncbi:histone-lysine N-methyltransferase SMYD1 isoform X2 [Latimeria chalumnae]|uniref:[histone H3]-lysine(4) N-trimethyltransferase n=1 Tax=Latimeria chalumnae TaxID=7897 RepID=H2ZVS1_LATCH|nr:PREDICTED: histone-lysine N-methyltransferase SMYD1 isoform X2 [Latimeria chalumnae]|eukprot:XP_006009896.1 PREDICTED: histone-lysine N-methyltransferase SMYD1 isoform X2 [Latimeria chalumnae]